MDDMNLLEDEGLGNSCEGSRSQLRKMLRFSQVFQQHVGSIAPSLRVLNATTSVKSESSVVPGVSL